MKKKLKKTRYKSRVDIREVFLLLAIQLPNIFIFLHHFLSLIADNVGCDLPVTEPVSFHGRITVSATEASLLLDPEYGMLHL